MASYTENLNLRKIDGTDAPPDITVLNQNWETLDQAVEDKTVKQLLTYDGADILKDGTRLEFDTLYDMLMNKNDFVVCLYDDVAYHPMEVTNEKITFIAVSPNGNTIDMPQISIANDDLSTITFNDTGARSKTWTPTATDVGAVPTGLIQYSISGVATDNDLIAKFNEILSGISNFTGRFFLVNPSTTFQPLGGSVFYGLIFKNATNYAVVVAWSYTGTQYIRRKVNGTWSNWTTDFLPLSGGTLTGALNINASSPELHLVSTQSARQTVLYSTTSGLAQILNQKDSNNYASLSLYNESADVNGLLFLYTRNGSVTHTYMVYGEHNKSLLTESTKVLQPYGVRTKQISYYKDADSTVHVCFNVDVSSISANTWTTIGVMPSGYRPSGDSMFTLVDVNAIASCVGYVDADGNIKIRSSVAHTTTQAYYSNFSYKATQ